ncbi:hypothetical protein M427DRAFT_143265 [Gonapodya prolifera JEL478]|uniref:F-box domain-containing protein n=1 Tax=Gonapodya prolifera (strain JEL478) TaxID=1344416 RepID=A0A139ASM6_GONPJ|nr:hypothetical protein M427DRAFT_143265 [Gonapodya prolifera JEL478]|eukprot:KXS19485.1 hypothetical protein M427DRAFT_143265 [Gonapodya prolifera JEL478]
MFRQLPFGMGGRTPGTAAAVAMAVGATEKGDRTEKAHDRDTDSVASGDGSNPRTPLASVAKPPGSPASQVSSLPAPHSPATPTSPLSPLLAGRSPSPPSTPHAFPLPSLASAALAPHGYLAVGPHAAPSALATSHSSALAHALLNSPKRQRPSAAIQAARNRRWRRSRLIPVSLPLPPADAPSHHHADLQRLPVRPLSTILALLGPRYALRLAQCSKTLRNRVLTDPDLGVWTHIEFFPDPRAKHDRRGRTRQIDLVDDDLVFDLFDPLPVDPNNAQQSSDLDDDDDLSEAPQRVEPAAVRRAKERQAAARGIWDGDGIDESAPSSGGSRPSPASTPMPGASPPMPTASEPAYQRLFQQGGPFMGVGLSALNRQNTGASTATAGSSSTVRPTSPAGGGLNNSGNWSSGVSIASTALPTPITHHAPLGMVPFAHVPAPLPLTLGLTLAVLASVVRIDLQFSTVTREGLWCVVEKCVALRELWCTGVDTVCLSKTDLHYILSHMHRQQKARLAEERRAQARAARIAIRAPSGPVAVSPGGASEIEHEGTLLDAPDYPEDGRKTPTVENIYGDERRGSASERADTPTGVPAYSATIVPLDDPGLALMGLGPEDLHDGGDIDGVAEEDEDSSESLAESDNGELRIPEDPFPSAGPVRPGAKVGIADPGPLERKLSGSVSSRSRRSRSRPRTGSRSLSRASSRARRRDSSAAPSASGAPGVGPRGRRSNRRRMGTARPGSPTPSAGTEFTTEEDTRASASSFGDSEPDDMSELHDEDPHPLPPVSKNLRVFGCVGIKIRGAANLTPASVKPKYRPYLGLERRRHDPSLTVAAFVESVRRVEEFRCPHCDCVDWVAAKEQCRGCGVRKACMACWRTLEATGQGTRYGETCAGCKGFWCEGCGPSVWGQAKKDKKKKGRRSVRKCRECAGMGVD